MEYRFNHLSDSVDSAVESFITVEEHINILKKCAIDAYYYHQEKYYYVLTGIYDIFLAQEIGIIAYKNENLQIDDQSSEIKTKLDVIESKINDLGQMNILVNNNLNYVFDHLLTKDDLVDVYNSTYEVLLEFKNNLTLQNEIIFDELINISEARKLSESELQVALSFYFLTLEKTVNIKKLKERFSEKTLMAYFKLTSVFNKK